nr:hypothetical protein Iba_chr09fCG6840 [Ipomoea batatas]
MGVLKTEAYEKGSIRNTMKAVPLKEIMFILAEDEEGRVFHREIEEKEKRRKKEKRDYAPLYPSSALISLPSSTPWIWIVEVQEYWVLRVLKGFGHTVDFVGAKALRQGIDESSDFRPPPPSLKFHFLNPFATRKFVGLKNETSTSFHQSSYLAFLLLLRCSLAPERLWRKWSQQLSSFFFKICDATVTVDFRRQQRRDNFWLQRTVTLLPSIFFPAAVGSSRASVLFSFRRQQVQLRLRSFSGNCSLLSLDLQEINYEVNDGGDNIDSLDVGVQNEPVDALQA